MFLDATFYVAFALARKKSLTTGRQCTVPSIHLRSVITLSFMAFLSICKSVGDGQEPRIQKPIIKRGRKSPRN